MRKVTNLRSEFVVPAWKMGVQLKVQSISVDAIYWDWSTLDDSVKHALVAGLASFVVVLVAMWCGLVLAAPDPREARKRAAEKEQ